jgi:hypothetical protein
MSLSSTDTIQIRKFGIVAFIFFGCLCALGFWNNKPIPTYFFGVLSMLGLAFILFPVKLSPVYTGWLKVAHILGRIVTILILTLAYYLVITPSGLLKTLFGGKPLPQKPNKELATYWVARDEPAQPKERFLKRY